MDNKKWHKRIAEIFWWSFTALPIILFVIAIIGMSINTHIDNATDYENIWSYYFSMYESTNFTLLKPIVFLGNISVPLLNSAFTDFFEIFNISADFALILGYVFGFMVSVQFYHLIYDIVSWLFIKLHCLLERSSH